MASDIQVRELRTLSVSSDGTAFRIGVRDGEGEEHGLVFPSDALRTLMLSLFRVRDTAFKRLLNDTSARLVYPAESCRLQSVPGTDQLILVLRSSDGFEAAFAIAPEALAGLAELVRERAPQGEDLPLRFN
jgi:hypothetical protein